jgi:TPP-dependent pyruvate/acetoin dehydrogenase alpha subunit
MEGLLLKADILTVDAVKQIHEETVQDIDVAVKFAEDSPEPDPKDVMEWVYA